MSSDLIIGGLLGMIAAVFFGMVIAGLWALIYFVSNRDYKYTVRIRNMTGGKAIMELHKAKKLNHPKLGECYYVPSLKSQKRHLLPYHGSSYELPISGKKWFVPFTYFDGEYTPEEFEPHSLKVQREVIVKVSDLTDVEKAIVEKRNPKELLDDFVKIMREKSVFILRPVNKAIRKWVLDADRVINEENELRLSWFERNKDFIMLTVMVIIAGVVCFLMILFSAQYATNLVNHPAATPQWAIDLLNASLNSSHVPPPIG